MKAHTMNDANPYSPVEVFTFIFSVSSLAGLTRLMRSTRVLTPRSIIGATLSTGFYSLGMAMVLLMIWRPRGLIGHRAPTVFLERNQAISSDLVKEGHG